MNHIEIPALETAIAYHQAWTSNGFEQAMSYIAEDILCQSPGGELVGVAAFRDFMGPFSQTLKGSSIISAFGDRDTALVMYDTETVVVESAPAAEFITVEHGLIVRMHIIFDRLPFEQLRVAARQAGRS